jgi:hypothetical protein
VIRAAHAQTVTRIPLRDAGNAHEVDAAVVSMSTPVPLPYAATTTATPDVLGAAADDAAALLGDWFGFGCSVLEQLRATAPDGAATRCQLWPEHFDLAVELGDEGSGSRAGFGASPGDAAHPEPYLYVSPWAPRRPDDPFWNDTAFPGASLPYAALTGDAPIARDAALAFFTEAQGVLTGA